jgi:hypothetical protein
MVWSLRMEPSTDTGFFTAGSLKIGGAHYPAAKLWRTPLHVCGHYAIDNVACAL